MSPTSSYPSPPGQTRSLPPPTKTGKIPFSIPGFPEEGETSYSLWGELDDDKVPLICLHGGPGIPHNYILTISLIHADYGIPVLMYDQIGCGASTRFPARRDDAAFWTPQLFMAELDNVRRTLGIQKYDLLGQSWGGMLAGQYATTQPDGLRKLIIADSPASMVTWAKVTGEQRAALPRDVRETLDRCEREGKTDSAEYEAAVMVFYKRHMCRLDPFPEGLLDSFAMLEGDNTVYWTMNGPSEFLVIGSLKTWDIVEDLATVTEKTVPGGILVINGVFDEAQDDCVRPYVSKPSAKVKWVQFALSAHLPHLEETERYIKELGVFLTEE